MVETGAQAVKRAGCPPTPPTRPHHGATRLAPPPPPSTRSARRRRTFAGGRRWRRQPRRWRLGSGGGPRGSRRGRKTADTPRTGGRCGRQPRQLHATLPSPAPPQIAPPCGAGTLTRRLHATTAVRQKGGTLGRRRVELVVSDCGSTVRAAPGASHGRRLGRLTLGATATATVSSGGHRKRALASQ